jgi:hypothetical protein
VWIQGTIGFREVTWQKGKENETAFFALEFTHLT